MDSIYVVRRPFKSVGIMYEMGSIIKDPTVVRLFKTKIREGKVIEVNEQNLMRIAEYVESRTGTNPIQFFEEAINVKKARKSSKLLEKKPEEKHDKKPEEKHDKKPEEKTVVKTQPEAVKTVKTAVIKTATIKG